MKDNVVVFPMTRPKRLLFVVTEDWYFWSHRLPIAKAALNQGFEVIVATKFTAHQQLIEQAGFKTEPLHWHRKGKNLFKLFSEISEIRALLKRVQPDIVHFMALKPIILGSIASFGLSHFQKIYAFAGLGTVFITKKKRYHILKTLVKFVLKFFLQGKNSHYIFQNQDDLRYLSKRNIIDSEKAVLIRGSGICLEQYQPQPLPHTKTLRFIFFGRLVRDKGVDQIIKAHQYIWHELGIKSELFIVGDLDPDNITSFSPQNLKDWSKLPGILIQKRVADVQKILASCHVSILMSKREGLPKSLLESAACGRPMIASDVPGCREVVIPGYNGALVPFGDHQRLATEMLKFIKGAYDLELYAKNARETVLSDLSAEHVAQKTLELYKTIAA